VARARLLGIVALVFAGAVLVVGGLRGARSLVALAFTLAVVVKVVVPLLLRGVDPILLAVGAGSVVTVITLLLTEGRTRVTVSATLGTFGALALTAVLAAIFSAAAQFTASRAARRSPSSSRSSATGSTSAASCWRPPCSVPSAFSTTSR
jgi:uncharacterized membrane protein